MFIRMYILSFLRNILIFILITPILNFYMLSLIYRVPNHDKEKLLTYISETGDLSYLKSPMKEFFYFYAIVDKERNIQYISDMSTLAEEKTFVIKTAVESSRQGRRRSLFNVLPEDASFDHGPIGEYYFSSKRVYDPVRDADIYHVIYNKDDYTFDYNMEQSRKANMIAMVCAGVISLFFAFLELRPTRAAWNNQKNFIANASHELRTPLSVINSVLDLEKKEITDIERERNNNIIRGEMGLLNNIARELMFLSRADVKEIRISKEPVDIYTLLLESYIAVVTTAPKAIIFDDFKCDEAVINADDTLIRQLVQILLKNAVEYTSEGGRISLTCRVIGSKIEIIVADNGIGISRKDQKHIFSRFYRVDKSQTLTSGNYGLGLSIAEWIVKKHRGTIKVESTVGVGSRFIVRLPI